MIINQDQWRKLHSEKRYRPKYPSEQVVQFVFRNFERDGQKKVLDLGCGAGRHVVFMANENIIPYGIDFSEEGVLYTKECLREYGHEIYCNNLEVGTLTELPYEDNSFDGLVCYGVLYYLPEEDIKKAVNEIFRVLKPGGKFFVQVRGKEDYRYCNSTNKKTEEKNTFIINEVDSNKCASSENGMLMHFFEEKELINLFSEFDHVTVDKSIETHDGQKFCDFNYLVMGEKRRSK